MDQAHHEIDQLGLSLRTRGSLVRGGVTSIKQVLAMSDDELLQLRNFGANQLIELKTRLVELGFLDRSVLRSLPQPYAPEDGYLQWREASERLLTRAAFAASELHHPLITSRHLLIAALYATEVATYLQDNGISVDTEQLVIAMSAETWHDEQSPEGYHLSQEAHDILKMVRKPLVNEQQSSTLYFIVLKLLLQQSPTCRELLARGGIDTAKIASLLLRFD